MAQILRETGETRVRVAVDRGDRPPRIDTGDGFLDHMLVTFARYAGLELEVEARGDLHHHLVEDVAIGLGMALADIVPEHAARYGWALVPMDEALVEAAIDTGGRAYYAGDLPTSLADHFFQSLSTHLAATLHIRVVRGRNRHHVIEAAVKATGFALRQALEEGDSVFSTKGAVRVTRDPAPGN
ncbi:MAG: imidazoleglycerol-phosphate dehydratase [Gammaproteobacteria bacterium]|nr:imidazoleglycerol-phosphate dehydratase [Gammaproteobacteria bacterium]MDE0650712.1 imidazoleglycerol-phosphate dehydratase [Gammaproteobacteria bacterium]